MANYIGTFRPLKPSRLLWIQCIRRDGDFVLIQPRTTVMATRLGDFNPDAEPLVNGEEYMVCLHGYCLAARAITSEGIEYISLFENIGEPPCGML